LKFIQLNNKLQRKILLFLEKIKQLGLKFWNFLLQLNQFKVHYFRCIRNSKIKLFKKKFYFYNSWFFNKTLQQNFLKLKIWKILFIKLFRKNTGFFSSFIKKKKKFKKEILKKIL
jgi:hypothetical protein